MTHSGTNTAQSVKLVMSSSINVWMAHLLHHLHGLNPDPLLVFWEGVEGATISKEGDLYVTAINIQDLKARKICQSST